MIIIWHKAKPQRNERAFREGKLGNECILSCWAGPDPVLAQPSTTARTAGKPSPGKESLFLPFSLQEGNLQVHWKLLFRQSGLSVSKFSMFCPLGGGGGEEANLGFVNLWIPGTLLLSWQSWENQFLSGKIIPAPAIFQVNQKGLSMFSTGSSSPVPLVVPAQTGIARNNSLIPHLFGSRDCHTLFISGDD